ncbi:unnamed protein product [Aureobasidium vineae]|uniref:5'-3' DNA helicase ZGRF1-like N-terminal domain-containing protein n=1 Tax=Aureobasidium vineae TaxID=2773715 RepID=A0A9N8P9W7_9PEZI|nr:unnamed protein product [Aureobasidium vineae]
MTAAVLRSSPNLTVPQTQNTAPVYEFNCLYTHDLRRKQKRWQDGFLRYHTFNKRVMVYDVPRNFLGDLHWTSGDDLQEGDEMILEKGGIMVQVSERIGTIQTDLSDLLQRKDKTPAKNPASLKTLVGNRPPHAAAAAPSFTPRTPHTASITPMKHKSLNTLLGRSRRPIGKASLPTESPYEARIRDLQAAEAQDQRERKRQRLDHSTQTTPMAAKQHSHAPAQKRANPVPHLNQGCEVIDLSSDTEDISAAQAASRALDAELLATSSPARLLESPAHRQVHPDHFRPIDRRPTAAKSAAVESPSARVSDRATHVDSPAPNSARPRKEVSVPREATNKAAEVPVDEPSRSGFFVAESEPQARGKSLKLIGGAPRKMLLFQSQNSRPSSSEVGTEGALRGKAQGPRQETSIGPAKDPVRADVTQPTRQPDLEQAPEDSVFQRRIQDRIARIEKKKKKPVLQRSSSDVTEQRPVVEKAANNTGLRKTTSAVVSPLDSPEDPSLNDFQFADITPLDFDDPIIDDSVAQPPIRPNKEPVGKTQRSAGRGAGMTTARSFKPLTVKAAPVLATKAAKPLVVEQKKNEDIGPWSKEAFDLMDWRPPNMQTKISGTA